MNETQEYRQIVAGPSPTSEEAPSIPSPSGESRSSIAYSAGSTAGGPTSSSGGGGGGQAPTGSGGESAGGGKSQSQWQKRVSTACLACKKSKRKCSGTAPCDNCRAFNRVCVFDESLDQRRRVAAKRTADELTYHRDLLNDLFKLIRAADEPHALKLLEIIRKDASAEEIRSYIDDTLSGLDHASSRPREDNKEMVSKLEDVREMLNVEGTGPSFRRKVMDIHFLCDEAPCKVPAKPWTTVTEDDDLVSHLISLYFTWDYPFYSFLDRDVFLRHMAMGNLESEFCSPFLVNAILANACHFSEFSEAYVVPGDILTKGADFFAEAERLRQQETAKIGLCSLQGTLCLYERYSLSEDDDMGYLMLHQAIRAGETLGLIGDKGAKLIPEQLDFDMDVSLRRTAWGLFHVDTVIHTSFLRASLVTKVNMNRIDRNSSTASDLWIPYPSHRNARPAYLSQYFDEACNLSGIALDISKELFSEDRSATSAAQHRQVKEGLYERLRKWNGALPGIFRAETKPPPYIILLRMRYYTLVINVFASNAEDDVSSITSDAPKTPESEPRHSPTTKYNAWELTQSAARGIASLARLHRREYGMNRAHYFAMYAINLALYAMLESESFDILDSDFLSLSSAFSVIASRSHLGRNLFHIFRQTVRSKSQGKRIRESSGVSEELKELFDEDAIAKGQNSLDDYAKGLEKLNQDERYHGLGNGSEGGSEELQEYPGLGLFDMLDRYESLSLGKDEIASYMTSRVRSYGTMDPNHNYLRSYDPENPERTNVMDIGLSEEAMPPSSVATSWPWAQSLVAPASLDSGPMDQQQQIETDHAATVPTTNPYLLPDTNSRLESAIFQPFPSAPSPSPKDVPPPQPAHTASHTVPHPPPFGVAPLHPPPYPQPRPAKVAIPRKAGNESTYRRHRSARACEPCRNRKIKCDGNKPMCRQCVEQRTMCTFLDVKRVREQKQLGTLGRKVERYEELLRELEPDVDIVAAKRIRRTLKLNDEQLEEGSDTESETSSLGSLDAIDLVEEDLNRNEKARATGFFGKNSEVAWMQKLENEAKHRSHHGIQDINRAAQCVNGRPVVPLSLMSYYLDDLDIPMFHEVDPSAVLSKELADKYFTAYMLVFHPSFNVVRRKTFTSQYERFIRQPSAVRPPRKWLAVLNMIFAIGCYYCRLTGSDVGDDKDSLVFLARARKLSLTEDTLFEHSDLQQVQVEFLVAFYLLARGQVNRASKFTNMAFRSAISLGINLRFVDDWTDHGAKEARSRLWWSIYVLEHSIAGLTGRVSCAGEGLSSVPLPVPYEEECFDRPDVLRLFQDITLRQKYLSPTLIQSDEEPRAHREWLEQCGPSPSSFFFCTVDLVFIMQAIINKVYSIEGIRERSGQIEQRIRKYGIKLDNWLSKVPSAYRFTTTGGREALNENINTLVSSGFWGDDDEEKSKERSYARERFTLAMHFYSSKITLCRPCLTHANARNVAPSTDTWPSHTNDGEDNNIDTDGDDADTRDSTGDLSNSDPTSESNTTAATTPSDTPKARRARFRTEMSLSCLRASCALLSLLPEEPDTISLTRLSPWWHHLHYIMQATTALLLGLSSWPTSPPAEEKYSTSIQAPVFGTTIPIVASTDPTGVQGATGTGTATGTGPKLKPKPTLTPNPLLTLQVSTVIDSTKKALRWLHHMAVRGDPAARRAFILSDGFMRRIAPNLGIGVDDLPEVDALPVPGSLSEEMPVPVTGVGSGVEGMSAGGEERAEERVEEEMGGMQGEMQGGSGVGEVDREWDGVGGRIAGVYQLG